MNTDQPNDERRKRIALQEEFSDVAGDAKVFAKLLIDRYTCRAYQTRPVPRETIEQILVIAQLTASWCNTQPWQLIITEGQATMALAKLLYGNAADAGLEAKSDIPFPTGYSGTHDQRRKVCGGQLYESIGLGRGDPDGRKRQMLENFRFFGAPHVAIITTPRELGVYGAVDCGAYIANFIIAARSLGVDTTPQAAIAMQSSCIRQHFHLPEERLILCGISFGYADLDHPANSFRTERAHPKLAVRIVD